MTKYLDTANATADCVLGIVAAHLLNQASHGVFGEDLSFAVTAWTVGLVAVAFNGFRNGLALELSPLLSGVAAVWQLTKGLIR